MQIWTFSLGKADICCGLNANGDFCYVILNAIEYYVALQVQTTKKKFPGPEKTYTLKSRELGYINVSVLLGVMKLKMILEKILASSASYSRSCLSCLGMMARYYYTKQ